MRASPALPPLHALRAFEAVGRLLSFRRAGEELLISQSAVSHHIRQLETYLKIRLFHRQSRSISLTPEGASYLADITTAFDLIGDSTRALHGRGTRTRVRVSLLPSFAANWLVPRLKRFHLQHPDIDIDLEPTLDLADLDKGEVDLAIRYGDGRWPRCRPSLLMAERLTPVVSPTLLPADQGDWQVSDLYDQTLLFSRNPAEWTIWSLAAGFDATRAPSIQLTDYNIVLQAAMDGQGVAMGRWLLVEDRLRAGTLIAPFSEVIQSDHAAHWLVTSQTRSTSPASETFITWLRTQVAA